MTTDRELLKLAAKAAGLTYRDDLWNAGHVQNEHGSWGEWNPLTDDGKALRLAVTLKLDVLQYPGDCAEARTQKGACSQEDVGSDLYAATRRAIVRAAAEIGRQMQKGGAA